MVVRRTLKELPYFRKGQKFTIKDMGHMDIGDIQAEAFQHLEKEFLLKGIVDTSKFQ